MHNRMMFLFVFMMLPPNVQALGEKEASIVRGSVLELCRGGSINGATSSIIITGEGSVKTVVLKKLVELGLSGKAEFKKSEWEGIEPLLPSSVNSSDYLECVKSLVPMFLEKYSKSKPDISLSKEVIEVSKKSYASYKVGDCPSNDSCNKETVIVVYVNEEKLYDFRQEVYSGMFFKILNCPSNVKEINDSKYKPIDIVFQHNRTQPTQLYTISKILDDKYGKKPIFAWRTGSHKDESKKATEGIISHFGSNSQCGVRYNYKFFVSISYRDYEYKNYTKYYNFDGEISKRSFDKIANYVDDNKQLFDLDSYNESYKGDWEKVAYDVLYRAANPLL